MEIQLPNGFQPTVAVIPARFQVPWLHAGHCELLDWANSRHAMVIVVLGVAPLVGTRENSLTYETRKDMVLAHRKSICVVPLLDQASDAVWSRNLDDLISTLVTPDQKVCIYGSRTSFKEHYFGRNVTAIVTPIDGVSGTKLRDYMVRGTQPNSDDYRCGMIKAAYMRYPMVTPTVDIAIFDGSDYSQIWLGRKKDESKFRFIGGFAKVGQSLEQSAKDEVVEETGLEVGELQHIGSCPVKCWRLRSEKVDGFVTTFYATVRTFGAAKADDDIAEVKKLAVSTLTPDLFVDEHQPLLQMLREWLEKRNLT